MGGAVTLTRDAFVAWYKTGLATDDQALKAWEAVTRSGVELRSWKAVVQAIATAERKRIAEKLNNIVNEALGSEPVALAKIVALIHDLQKEDADE